MTTDQGNGSTPRQRFLTPVTKAATEVVALEKRFEPARDEFCLATAEGRSLFREMAAAPITLHGPDVPAATRRKYERSLRRIERARAAYEDVAQRLSEARGQLINAQRDLAEFDRREQSAADQAAQDAARSPEEREQRRIRAAVEADRAIPR